MYMSSFYFYTKRILYSLLRAITVCVHFGLTPLDPPTYIVELEDTEVSEVGSDVVLKCSAYGDPRPQYRWSYYQAKNVWVKNEDGVSLLHIRGVSGENIGTYTCFAFNKLREVNKSVKVTVKGTVWERAILKLLKKLSEWKASMAYMPLCVGIALKLGSCWSDLRHLT